MVRIHDSNNRGDIYLNINENISDCVREEISVITHEALSIFGHYIPNKAVLYLEVLSLSTLEMKGNSVDVCCVVC